MPAHLAIQIGRELLLTAMLVSLPVVVVSLVIGLVISIFQTVTSIQEQTLGFAPRIFGVGIAMVITLPWTLEIMTNFTYRMFWHLTQIVR